MESIGNPNKKNIQGHGKHTDNYYNKRLILKKIRGKTLFSFFNPVVVEPLELEYIEKVLEKLPLSIVIEDSFFTKNQEEGDIYLFNGYNTGFESMKEAAKLIKRRDPAKLIIVSGVDAQVNGERYMEDEFDFVFTSSDLTAFRDFIEELLKGETLRVPGLIINHGNRWERVPKEITPPVVEPNWDMDSQNELPMPSRNFYNEYRDNTYYLHYPKVSLVKKSRGCPYSCRFCFCRNLNDGEYMEGSFQKMFQEIRTIDADYFWIVDDVFLKNKRDVKLFLMAFKEHQDSLAGSRDKSIKREPEKLIVYLRADFIRSEKDSLNALKEAGITEIIIGLESVDEKTLKNYQKGISGDDNTEAVRILNESGIAYTALFMVDPSHGIEDFKALKKFIKDQGIRKYTFSIFTPIKGADDYEEYQEKIMDFDQNKYDFLHLVLPPKHMSRKRFQWEFIKLHIFQFFHSEDTRAFLIKLLLRGGRGR